MSQRSSGPHAKSITEDERLLWPPSEATRDAGRPFTRTAPWRVLRIMGEFVEGFDTLADIPSAVSFFGSARTTPDDPIYERCVATAHALAAEGFAVITGGGPGIMEAANRGAYDAGGLSIGLNIVLPLEQCPNPYITPELSFQFHYFAIRKLHFLLRAKALVAFPGGFGTLDELFETLTLIQTRKVTPVPVLLFGQDFWSRIINFEELVAEGTIDQTDLELFQYVETAEQAWDAIKTFYVSES
jgi:uncharacterized protein (TIGR00730 family)